MAKLKPSKEKKGRHTAYKTGDIRAKNRDSRLKSLLKKQPNNTQISSALARPLKPKVASSKKGGWGELPRRWIKIGKTLMVQSKDMSEAKIDKFRKGVDNSSRYTKVARVKGGSYKTALRLAYERATLEAA